MKYWRLWLATIVLSACSVDTFFYGEPNRPEPQKLSAFEVSHHTQVLWRERLKSKGERLYLRPVSASGVIYAVGSEGVLQAWNSEGSRIYRVDLEQDIQAGLAYGAGRLFAVNRAGEVLALRAEDGQSVWRTRLSSQALAAPVYDQGLLLVRTVDGVIHALDVQDGDVLWRYHSHQPRITLAGQGQPVVAQGAVLFGGDDGKLTILHQGTGLIAAEQFLGRPELRPDSGLVLQDVNSSLQLRDDVVFGSVYGMHSFAFDLRSGQLLWTQASASSHQDIALSASMMLLSNDEGHVMALSLADGRPLWRQEALQGRRLSPPVVTRHGIMVLDAFGYLHLLAPEDGRLLGRVQIAKAGSRSAAIKVDGRYIWQLTDGSIIAVDEWQ